MLWKRLRPVSEKARVVAGVFSRAPRSHGVIARGDPRTHRGADCFQHLRPIRCLSMRKVPPKEHAVAEGWAGACPLPPLPHSGHPSPTPLQAQPVISCPPSPDPPASWPLDTFPCLQA